MPPVSGLLMKRGLFPCGKDRQPLTFSDADRFLHTFGSDRTRSHGGRDGRSLSPYGA